MGFGSVIGILIVLGILWSFFDDHKKRKHRYLDHRGYERNGYKRLVHRDVAFKHLYNYPKQHSKRFGEYDVHHIDCNKRNNSPSNLKILTREEHKREHGF